MLAACSLFQARGLYLPFDADNSSAPSQQVYLLSWQDANGSPAANRQLVLENGMDGVTLVALNNVGMTLFKLRRTAAGDQLHTTHFYQGRPLEAGQLLSVLLLLTWPVDRSERLLTPAWRIVHDDGLRQWYFQDTLAGRAEYKQDENGLTLIDVQHDGRSFQLRSLQSDKN